MDEKAQIEKVEKEARRLVAMPAHHRPAALLDTVSPQQLKNALRHYARGRTPEAAAKLAGMTSVVDFQTYLQQDRFGDDLRKVMRGVLENEHAPKAIAFLAETVSDKTAPYRCRVDSAKILLDRAGYVAAAPDPHAAGKELENMSLDELNRYILELKANIVSRAKDVTPIAAEDGLEIDVPAAAPPQAH